MTIHRSKGTIAFSCDGCPEAAEYETGDFRTALSRAIQEGWVTAQVKGEFLHYCPDCAKQKGID